MCRPVSYMNVCLLPFPFYVPWSLSLSFHFSSINISFCVVGCLVSVLLCSAPKIESDFKSSAVCPHTAVPASFPSYFYDFITSPIRSAIPIKPVLTSNPVIATLCDLNLIICCLIPEEPRSAATRASTICYLVGVIYCSLLLLLQKNK